MTFGTAYAAPHNPNKGYLVPQPPDDTVSRLRFSPEGSPAVCLLAASWNGLLRLWKVDSPTGPAAGILEGKDDKPILDAAWAVDGQSVFYAALDNTVKRWDLSSNTTTTVAAHTRPVRSCVDNFAIGYLATASWDRTLCYWDARAPTGAPIASVPLSERPYAMDALGYLMVVALAARRIAVFDVRKPTTPFQEKFSQLQYQNRSVACWPDTMGYVVGDVHGQVSVDFVQEPRENANGVFTCHRERGAPAAINAVRFNMNTGVFATASSDGNVFFWDKDRLERARVKRFERMEAPICDVDFLYDGSMYAYAVGYDWSQGVGGNNLGAEKNYIVIQAIDDGDMSLATRNGYGSTRGRGGSNRGRRRGGRR